MTDLLMAFLIFRMAEIAVIKAPVKNYALSGQVIFNNVFCY